MWEDGRDFLRRHYIGVVMSLAGVAICASYLLIEYFYLYRAHGGIPAYREHLTRPPIPGQTGLEHLLIVLLPPLFIGLGYYLDQRAHLRYKIKTYAEELHRSYQIRDLVSDLVKYRFATELRSLSKESRTLLKKLEKALKEKEEDKALEILRKVVKETDDLAQGLEEVLTLLQLENTRHLEKKRGDLYPLLRRMVEKARERYGREKEVSILLLGERGAFVDFHPRIEDLFSLLLQCAIERSPEGSEVPVKLEVHPREIRITLHEKGEKIPSEERERVFEKFKGRGEWGGGKGRGLKMATVRRLAELHGGRVWVEDAEGEGNLYIASLPR
jgi:signal transduction histidine kinase